MIPLFIKVEVYPRYRKQLVNISMVTQIIPMDEDGKCMLSMPDGKKIVVKGTIEEIDAMIFKEAVDIRLECLKKLSEC